MNFKLRDIILSLAVIIDYHANKIFKNRKIKEIKNFNRIIEKLEKLEYITKNQSEYLNDFRELRNFVIHKKFHSKIYFKNKPLLIRSRIRNLITEVCNIIIYIENKSNIKSDFNHEIILKFIKEDSLLEIERLNKLKAGSSITPPHNK